MDEGRRFLLTGIGVLGGAAIGRVAETRLEKVHSTNPFDKAIAKAMEAAAPIFFKAFEKNTSRPAGIYSTTSQLEKIKSLVQASALPPTLKTLVPYLPFIFSNYRSDKIDENGGKGLWNFSQQQAKSLGLLMEEKKEDKRFSLEESTKAALLHLQKVCDDIQTDTQYRTLCKKCNIPPQDNSLLAFAAISSFVPHGEIVGAAAFEKLAHQEIPTTATDKDLAVKMGLILESLDSHADVQEEDRKFMASLPFHAEALRKLHKKEIPTTTSPAIIRKAVGGLVAGTVALGSTAGSDLYTGDKLSRRMLILAGVTAVGEFVTSAAYDYLSGQDFTPTPFQRNETLIPLPQTDPGLLEAEMREVYMSAFQKRVNRSLFRLQGFSAASPTPKEPSDYHFCRLMAEESYALFEQRSDSKYRQLAHYYFTRCQKLRHQESEDPFLERAIQVAGAATYMVR